MLHLLSGACHITSLFDGLMYWLDAEPGEEGIVT